MVDSLEKLGLGSWMHEWNSYFVVEASKTLGATN